MNEQSINEFLQKTRRTSDFFRTIGQVQLAHEILVTGSELSKLSLAILRIGTMPVSCREMNHRLRGRIAQAWYFKYGICLYCDHLLSDDQLPRMDKEENHE